MRLLATAVLLASAACGDDIHPGTGSDAGHDSRVDSPRDAPADTSVDANTQISITVYGDGNDVAFGQPAVGTAVYFTAPDNTVQMATTDANGVASVLAPQGATALVARQYNPTNWSLSAFVGLQPGDSITTGIATPSSAGTALGTINFTLPVAVGATSYQVLASCSTGYTGTLPTGSFDVTSCSDATSASIVGVALDTNGNAISFSALSAQNLAQLVGTTVAMPAYTAAGTVTGSFANIANGTTTIRFATQYHKGTDPVIYGQEIINSNVTTSSFTLSGPIATYGDHTHFSVKVTVGSFPLIAFLHDPTSLVTAFQLDGSTMITPANAGAYDKTADAMTWSESASGVPANFVVADLSWVHSGIVVHYEFAGPRDPSMTFKVPALPAALSTIQYTSSEAIYNGISLESYLGLGYHAVLVAPDRSSLPRWLTNI